MITFAIDEDLAIRELVDLPLICPRDQVLALGTDGLFQAGDPWTLRASGVAFDSRGIRGGELVHLSGPTSRFRPPGELLVVESAGVEWLRLRRKGFSVGEGSPPGLDAGLEGVEYAVMTLRPQLTDASHEIARRLGISDLVEGRRPSDLEDVGALRDVVVLCVLHRLHQSMAREAGRNPDIFAMKAERLKSELGETLSRLVLHWAGSAIPSSGFQTRIGR
jgi:hypothetical protein